MVGGSWLLAMIAEIYAAIFSEKKELYVPQLKANDIDVYHGGCTTDTNATLVVNFNMIEYKAVDDLDW